MTERVYIAGVSMTPFGVHTSSSVAQLARQAVRDCLRDAGLAAAAVDAVFYANTTQSPLEGQHMVGGQIALAGIGVDRIPLFNIENACASGSSALNLAIAQVRSGNADVALAVGVEKMNVGDRSRSMAVFKGAYDVSRPAELHRVLSELGGEQPDAGLGDRSIFMDIYAAMARAHMAAFGSTQKQIAAVAAKNHDHAVHNERAFFRKSMSPDEVLAARPLAFPITVPMCSPLTDGAAAAVVCRESALKRYGVLHPVRVRACRVATGLERDLHDYESNLSRLCGLDAYEEAGVGPADIDVAEVHDATAFAEIQLSEMLGLFPAGDGGPAAERGDTRIGGPMPINPSGGLESKGHPLAATGLGQIFELVDQLRGRCGPRQVEAARLGLAENGGGFHRGQEAVAVVTILEAV